MADGRQWTLPLRGEGTARLEPLVDELDPTAPATGARRSPPESPAAQRRLFDVDGVQMTFNDWRAKVTANIDAAGRAVGPRTKTGRSWRRRAAALKRCGEFAQVKVCAGCGVVAGTSIISDCTTRACPLCARVKANGKRRALEEKLEELRKRRTFVTSYRDGRPIKEALSMRMVTLTARFDPDDPDDLAPAAVATRHAGLRAALGRMWAEVLSLDETGERIDEENEKGKKVAASGIHYETEVGFGGMLHLHVAYWGRFIRPCRHCRRRSERGDTAPCEADCELARCRRIVNEELPEGGGFDIQRVYGKAGVRELVKYLVKGSHFKRTVGPNRTRSESFWMDPALAAVVEVAFFRVHTSGGRGSLRSINVRGEELEEKEAGEGDQRPCSACGHVGWSLEWVQSRHLRPGDVTGVARAAIPKSARAGPGRGGGGAET